MEIMGHQAPIGYRVNRFNSIEIEDFAYCKSHNFVYNPEREEKKLYKGKACHHTDARYVDTDLNFFRNTMLYWTRWKDISLKACIRRTLSCRNIPVGTVVDFKKSWHYVGKKFSNSYKFRIRKKNKFDPAYEVNDPTFALNFSSCERSKELVNELRNNGFLVMVSPNSSFLLGMLNTASKFTGGSPVDDRITGETAIAYGHDRKIGFSSYDDDFMGYSNGCGNILWDKFGEFNKWSQCNEIPKETGTEEIIKTLKS